MPHSQKNSESSQTISLSSINEKPSIEPVESESRKLSRAPQNSPPSPPTLRRKRTLTETDAEADISFNPNAISKPSVFTENVNETEQRTRKVSIQNNGPPIVPPRPKHLSKKYGMLAYLNSRVHIRPPTIEPTLPRSKSMPSFINITSSDKEIINSDIKKSDINAKIEPIKRKISNLIPPIIDIKINKKFHNSLTQGFTRELRKVKSTLSLAKKSTVSLTQNNKLDDNKNEEYKHDINIEIIEDNESINESKRSSILSNIYMIQKSYTAPIVKNRKHYILKRSKSLPNIINGTRELKFSFLDSPPLSLIFSSSLGDLTDRKDNREIDEKSESYENVAIFITSYSSDDDNSSKTSIDENNEITAIVHPEPKSQELTKLEPTSPKSFKKIADTINNLKRKSSSSITDSNRTFLTVNSLLNLKRNLSSDSLNNLTTSNKYAIKTKFSSKENLNEDNLNKGQARLRRAAVVVKTTKSVSTIFTQDRKYCCHNCKKKLKNDKYYNDPQYERDGSLTIMGRCWHRLYVSKARLQATSTTSELFAAFAMIALVEMQINTPCTVPDIFWILFAMNTTLLVGVNVLALMISTFILPNIHAVTRLHPTALIAESPHDTMKRFIELAWGFSTFLSLMLSIINIALISWVKFWDFGVAGAITSTGIVIPSLAVFIAIAIYFYRVLEDNEREIASEERYGQESTAVHPTGFDNPGFDNNEETEIRHDDISIKINQIDEDSREDNLADGSLTPRGLQWRSLHVSLAKLEATSSASELMSGFATMATVELQTNSPTNLPTWMFVLLAINSTVLVLLNIFALMISTFILPCVEAITHQHGSNLAKNSPHQFLRKYVETAWILSTVLGMLVFLFEVIILSWTKFWDFSFDGALASTVITLIAMVIFIGFTAYFYYTLVDHKCETTDDDLKQLEDMKKKLDEATSVININSIHMDENFTGERLI